MLLGRGAEKKWYGTNSDKLDGEWDKTVERMMLIFAESGLIWYFVPPVPLKDGNEEAKGKKSIHFKGGEENIWIDSARDHFCKSAQCLRSSSRSVQRTVKYSRA